MSVDVKWTGTRPRIVFVGTTPYQFAPGEVKTMEVDPDLPGFDVIKQPEEVEYDDYHQYQTYRAIYPGSRH